MAYDKYGRWVPSADINWTADTENIREQLTEAGLDWRHGGTYAFRTNAWGQMSESQRLDVVQAYDAWYDQGGQLALEDEAWGLDIERGLTYNSSWTAQEAFHDLTGGNHTFEWVEGSKYDLQNPYKYADKVRDTIVRERTVTDSEGNERTMSLLSKREHPMDWRSYSQDELFRATMDELIEQDYMMFMGPGADFDNATQVRAASREIQSWVTEAYDKARELGEDGAWAENELQRELEQQRLHARLHNARYESGDKTRGPLHNQQVAIRKYQPWNKFDPDTGTRTKINPVTGEIRDSFTHTIPPEPTRMTLTGDSTAQSVDEGIFYSPTIGLTNRIEESMLEKPPSIPTPNLTIRGIGTPRRTENIPSDWAMKGGTT